MSWWFLRSTTWLTHRNKLSFGILLGILLIIQSHAFNGFQRPLFVKGGGCRMATTGTTLADTSSSLIDLCQQLNDAIPSSIAKNRKVKVAPSQTHRLGLVATSRISSQEVVLSVPHDQGFTLAPALAKENIFKDIASNEDYQAWSGDLGWIALLILNEVANLQGKGLPLPKRDDEVANFMKLWVQTLPGPEEMSHHPFLWSEDEQEIMQSSSSRKLYKLLDDMDDDATWLLENIWSKNRDVYPEEVKNWRQVEGHNFPCFTPQGFSWAVAVAASRSYFVDGSLRLIPLLDFANHSDRKTNEVAEGFMGTFGNIKGSQLRSGNSFKEGEEVFCSYGPKSASEYVLDHGFCPPKALSTCVAEVSLELDPDDRFYEDKLDILEFETYDDAPMDNLQTYDLVSEPGRDGEPDPAMMQFARLQKLGGTDAFLLEALFRKEVWGFMSLPVSEPNELDVVSSLIATCQGHLDEMKTADEDGDNNSDSIALELCAQVRAAERKAFTRTMEFLQREREALDLKEYYQERRLKGLGLDSDWNPDEENPDVGWGQSRVAGAADYDF